MMRRTRRKVGLILLVIILAGLVAWIFRYPLVLKFQHARLKGITCSEPANQCWEKIWVHRVNSLPRYDLLKDQFKGFEADLVFNTVTQHFSVYHPPVTGEGDTLSLEKFLQHADISNHRFWFDTRFVAQSNIQETLMALSKLNDTMNIKKNCVFELYDASAAAIFTQRGYTASFNMSEEMQQQLEKDGRVRDSINQQLKDVMYVSQDARYLPTIKKIFPEKKIVTWELHFSSFFNRKPLRALLNDPQVAILLVNIKTPFYR